MKCQNNGEKWQFKFLQPKATSSVVLFYQINNYIKVTETINPTEALNVSKPPVRIIL